MNLQSEKIELIKLLLDTENPTIIESIKTIFQKNSEVDYWDKLSKEQRMEIDQGIREIENNETIDYDSFIAKHR